MIGNQFIRQSISSDFINHFLANNCGYNTSDVLPGHIPGYSTGIVNVGGHAMSITTKSFFVIPDFGVESATWFAMQLVFNAAEVTCLKPKYISFNLNLPLNCGDAIQSAMWKTIHRVCELKEVTIVSESTETSSTSSFPWIGSVTIISEGELDAYVSPAFAECDDEIIVTNGSAQASTVLLTAMYPETLSKQFGPSIIEAGNQLFNSLSISKQIELARTCGLREGGIKAIYDASDIGTLGSLVRFAEICNCGFVIDQKAIEINSLVNDVCSYFGINPLFSLGAGSLILICHKDNVEKVLNTFNQNGVSAQNIGHFTNKDYGFINSQMGIDIPVVCPKEDALWMPFFNAYQSGLR